MDSELSHERNTPPRQVVISQPSSYTINSCLACHHVEFRYEIIIISGTERSSELEDRTEATMVDASCYLHLLACDDAIESLRSSCSRFTGT